VAERVLERAQPVAVELVATGRLTFAPAAIAWRATASTCSTYMCRLIGEPP